MSAATCCASRRTGPAIEQNHAARGKQIATKARLHVLLNYLSASKPLVDNTFRSPESFKLCHLMKKTEKMNQSRKSNTAATLPKCNVVDWLRRVKRTGEMKQLQEHRGDG